LAHCPPKLRSRKCAEFIQEWNKILRRFYGGRDFTAVGPVLLRAATIALVTAQRRVEICDADIFEVAA
jgi:hypothetical protein